MTKCETCKYSTTRHRLVICEYLLKTGAPRGCPPGDECDKYVERKKSRRRKNDTSE